MMRAPPAIGHEEHRPYAGHHPEPALRTRAGNAGTRSGSAPFEERLFRARETRIRPGLDDKIMADWNGLMIAALANAASALDKPDWVARAVRAYEFIAETLSYREGPIGDWLTPGAPVSASSRAWRSTMPP